MLVPVLAGWQHLRVELGALVPTLSLRSADLSGMISSSAAI